MTGVQTCALPISYKYNRADFIIKMTEAEDPNKRNFTQLAKEVNLTNNRDELP